MKKIIFLAGAMFITNAAVAQTTYYASVKLGLGDATLYVDGDTTMGEYLEDILGPGYTYNGRGTTWEFSPALGLDWSPNRMYTKHNPFSWFHLRLEGEFGYNNYREKGNLKYNFTVTDKITMKMDQFFMLANGYADFHINDVIPYVGLGLGYSFGTQELTSVDTNNIETSDFVNDKGIIYALHLGVAFKYSEITTVDLGYRRVYAPSDDNGMNVFGSFRLGGRFRI